MFVCLLFVRKKKIFVCLSVNSSLNLLSHFSKISLRSTGSSGRLQLNDLLKLTIVAWLSNQLQFASKGEFTATESLYQSQTSNSRTGVYVGSFQSINY